jgi:hypothetical protein
MEKAVSMIYNGYNVGVVDRIIMSFILFYISLDDCLLIIMFTLLM